jgi:hypothetical protein
MRNPIVIKQGKMNNTMKMASIIMLLLAGTVAAFLGGCDIGQHDASSDGNTTASDPYIDESTFKHFESDYDALREFIQKHDQVLHLSDSTAIFYNIDDLGNYYFYTDSNMENVVLDSNTKESFENVYLLMNAHGGWGYILFGNEYIAFVFSNGTHMIVYSNGKNLPRMKTESSGEYASIRYADHWYYLEEKPH